MTGPSDPVDSDHQEWPSADPHDAVPSWQPPACEMTDSLAEAAATAAATRWWTTYFDVLRQQGVRESLLPWYRYRIGQMVERHPGRSSRDWSGDEVVSFILDLGTSRAAPWQVEQAIDAFHRFGVVTRAAWAEEIDWSSLRDEMAATPEERAVIASGVLPEDPVLRRFAECLRIRHYSLRTEDSYLLSPDN
jgi:hypothetical protein